jgi:hypothetical protein
LATSMPSSTSSAAGRSRDFTGTVRPPPLFAYRGAIPGLAPHHPGPYVDRRYPPGRARPVEPGTHAGRGKVGAAMAEQSDSGSGCGKGSRR